MKHFTHMYLAAKAMDLTVRSVYNSGRRQSRSAKIRERNSAKRRYEILNYYRDFIVEATWAPDDILHDNNPNHIFKLFAEDEFPLVDLTQFDAIEGKETMFYRFGGALPFRVDHLARNIVSMAKLRHYNDNFTLRQIMYQYVLLSHYIADAHVPMHCDLRDDPPSQGRHTDPSRKRGRDKPVGKYMKSSEHGRLEGMWEDAVLPLALEDDVIRRTFDKASYPRKSLTEAVSFTEADCNSGGEIRLTVLDESDIMDFMIDVCVRTKERSRRLYPVASPATRDDDVLAEVTRESFAECIGALNSVWRSIWIRCAEL